MSANVSNEHDYENINRSTKPGKWLADKVSCPIWKILMFLLITIILSVGIAAIICWQVMPLQTTEGMFHFICMCNDIEQQIKFSDVIMSVT